MGAKSRCKASETASTKQGAWNSLVAHSGTKVAGKQGGRAVRKVQKRRRLRKFFPDKIVQLKSFLLSSSRPRVRFIGLRALRLRMLFKPDLVFIHIPKNGGLTVWITLHKEIGMQRLETFRGKFPNRGPITPTHKHWPSLVSSGLVSKTYAARALKFAIMRNPYDRFQSCFYYLRKLGNTHAENELVFLDEVEKCLDSMGDDHRLSAARPQSHWLLDDSGKKFVDKIFFVEDMGALESFLSSKLEARTESDIREEKCKHTS